MLKWIIALGAGGAALRGALCSLEVALMLLILALPLRTLALFDIQPWKIAGFTLLPNHALAIFIFFLWLLHHFRRQWDQVTLTNVGKAVLLYLGWVTASLLWVTDLKEGIAQWARIVIGAMVFFMLVDGIPDKRTLRRLMVVWTLGAIVQGIFSIFEFATQGSSYLASNIVSQHRLFTPEARSGSVLNPTMQANFFTISLLFCTAFSLTELRRIPRLAWVLGWAIMFLGLVLTLSRSGWLSFAVGFCFLLLRLGQGRWLLYPAMGAAALVGLTAQWPITQAFLIRLASFNEIVSQTGTVGIRLVFYKIALSSIVQRPLQGLGAGSQTELYARHRAIALYVHNLYLYLVLEFGLIGLALFLGILVQLYLGFKDAFQRAQGSLRVSLEALLAGIVSYLVAGMAHMSFQEPYAWGCLGLAGAAVNVAVWAQRSASPGEPAPVPEARPEEREAAPPSSAGSQSSPAPS